MRVVSSFEIAIQGPRPEMQDVTLIDTSVSGVDILAVFDGHGSDGLLVAQTAAQYIRVELGKIGLTESDPYVHAAIAKNAIRHANSLFPTNDTSESVEGGTTATLATLKHNQLVITWVGDSEAALYKDDGTQLSLAKPHNTKNVEEVERVKSMGYGIYGVYFGDRLAVSRAIGDFDCGFVLGEPESVAVELDQPATLVVASDGVWGASENRENLSRCIRSNNLEYLQQIGHYLVEGFSETTRDNASMILARIE